jgi:hypothetical protein
LPIARGCRKVCRVTRTARAIVSLGSEILGGVPPFGVASPWWPDVEPVAARLGELLGVPAVVLRLVSVAGGESPQGGEVTYHAEVGERPSFGFCPVSAEMHQAVADGEPRRAPYARPGGVFAALAWADAELARIGRPRTGQFTQVKTWNLAHVLRLPTAGGPVWCKSTRLFETAEQPAIALAARHDPELVPQVLAARPDERVTLFGHAPGEDGWDAGPELLTQTVRRWVGVQAGLAGFGDPAIPARPLRDLPGRLGRVFESAPLTAAERSAAAALARREVPGGLPDTLVHGDLHSGNWRSDGTGRVTILDWSGSYLGHPADDLVTLVQRQDKPLADLTTAAWCAAWRAAVPGCDPEAALAAARPLVHLEKAALYQRFLDHIEPSERPYHQDDPATQVRLALAVHRQVR